MHSALSIHEMLISGIYPRGILDVAYKDNRDMCKFLYPNGYVVEYDYGYKITAYTEAFGPVDRVTDRMVQCINQNGGVLFEDALHVSTYNQGNRDIVYMSVFFNHDSKVAAYDIVTQLRNDISWVDFTFTDMNKY